jgi:hypothetical protein
MGKREGGVAMQNKKQKQQSNIEAIIARAVKAGIEAGRTQAGQAPVDAYRATERRLYALPTLYKKVEDERQHLEELQQSGFHERSKDIARFNRSGVRLTLEEKLEALIQDILATIAADEYEIATIKKSLEIIENDAYYFLVKRHYFDGVSDDDIGVDIKRDRTTVCRQRGRLIRILAVWFYGAQAL